MAWMGLRRRAGRLGYTRALRCRLSTRRTQGPHARAPCDTSRLKQTRSELAPHTRCAKLGRLSQIRDDELRIVAIGPLKRRNQASQESTTRSELARARAAPDARIPSTTHTQGSFVAQTACIYENSGSTERVTPASPQLRAHPPRRSSFDPPWEGFKHEAKAKMIRLGRLENQKEKEMPAGSVQPQGDSLG
ncbi:hypothetical protein NMY22_g6493 [Coprinellus aureogranulatus]|nr:hypothetical protein NMY22_g6493 [Coprinellus aureogranulatus]